MRVRIAAPRSHVFRCLTTFTADSPIWLAGLPPEVLAEESGTVIVRLRSRRLGRLAGGIHRVRSEPPDRVLLELLDGAVGSLHETLVLEADGEATWVSWHGDVSLAFPLARVVERVFAGPVLAAEMRNNLRRYRVTIEASALALGLTRPPRPHP